jgi:LuxR family transcriptional activator of conjugal transfer of Ti plasmids
MHRDFQRFIDRLAAAPDAPELQRALGDLAAALGLGSFAYLCRSDPARPPTLVSNYPAFWVRQYLEHRYDLRDPVITRAMRSPRPFEWGPGCWTGNPECGDPDFFREATALGVRCGFTIPIHGDQAGCAAVSFAAPRQSPRFHQSFERQTELLYLIALLFHRAARRTLAPARTIDGVALSEREFECLHWAALGKSIGDIGAILGISRRTAAFHLDNAREKLDVRSLVQAVARFTAARGTGD